MDGFAEDDLWRVVHGGGTDLEGCSEVQLIATDPPYGTNQYQTVEDRTVGFRTVSAWRDPDIETAVALSLAVAAAADRVLTADGVLAIQVDWRIVHALGYLIPETTSLTFRREIIHWSEIGGVSKTWWTNKHSTILLFDRAGNGRFHLDRVPTTPRKARDGRSDLRRINSVWELTMSTGDRQRGPWETEDGPVGPWPNQKPIEVYRRLIAVHTDPGDLVVDPFMGSGTTGVAAVSEGRRFVGFDIDAEAVKIARVRLRAA